MEKINVIQTVTEKIIALIEKVTNGDIEYWIPLSGLAYNPSSKHTYTSINQLLLSLELYEKDYSHNNWMTFKQIANVGGSVKEGEKATMITFSEVIYSDTKGNTLSAEAAKKVFNEAKLFNQEVSTYSDAGIKSKRFLKLYYVFNVQQVVGLSEDLLECELMKLTEIDRVAAAENIVQSSGAKIVHVSGDSAHYNPGKDKIQMPSSKQFKSAEKYYATLFHELIHWTGSKTRLNRSFGTKKTPEYAFEELIAELGSAFLCAQLNMQTSFKSSAAYMKTWLQALENDKNYIIKAVSHAERGMLYLLQTQSASV